MRQRRVILNEWVLTTTVPTGGRPDRVRVIIENVNHRDRDFVTALARMVEVWLNATRKARR